MLDEADGFELPVAQTSNADDALVAALRRLDARGYAFVAPSPRTHQYFLDRNRDRTALTLRDALGWGLPFPAELLDPELLALLRLGEALVPVGTKLRSRYRISRVGDHLFYHSAYPTDRADDVFLGPDTYRFVRFLRGAIGSGEIRTLVDMGSGSGAGAICVADLMPAATRTLIDRNPQALRLSSINAAAAGVAVTTVEASTLAAAVDDVDLVIANPPFMIDAAKRSYRDGGAMLGAELSLEWAMTSARLLKPGARMLLYTGSAVVEGHDALRTSLERALPPLGCTFAYEEIDPDIFGEELLCPGYENVDRIAAVGVTINR